MMIILTKIWELVYKFLRAWRKKNVMPIRPIKAVIPSRVDISIEYMTQRDNTIHPHKTCFPTSVAMVVKTLELASANPRSYLSQGNVDDYLIIDVENNLPFYKGKLAKIMGKWAYQHHPRYFYRFWKWYLEKHVGGFKVTLMKAKNTQGIRNMIARGIPVVCGTVLTRAGHVVVIRGFDPDADGFIVNDPYGKKPYQTASEKKNGKAIFYGGHKWLGINAIAIEKV